MGEHDVRVAQARIDEARGGRPQEPRPDLARRAPQSLEDALRRVLSGEVRPWASDEEVARYEAARARRERRARAEALGLDRMLADDALAAVVADTLEATEALDVVRRWVAYQAGLRARGACPILALLGGPGVGKTVAAAWLLLSEGGRYVTAGELARLSRADWGDERAAHDRLLASRVLVVDELGTEGERAAAAATQAIHEVVDQRQSSSRLTLLIGNIGRAELRQRYDARTIDRLRAVAKIVELSGESMRRGSL
jgi:DNA replication protein DnaC